MVIKYTDRKIIQFYHSISYFFLFLGYLAHETLIHWRAVSWRTTIMDLLRACAAMVLPLAIISMLLGMSLNLSIHYLLAGFKLHNQAMDAASGMLIRDFAPLPISFVLCVHCGLNLIEYRHINLNRPPEKVILSGVIPLIVGLNLCALLFYTYVLIAFFIGIFLMSYYFLNAQFDEFWLRLSETVQISDLLNSLAKTLLLATITGITSGYYYFNVACKEMLIRTAVSRMITRGLFWIIVISVLLKL